jgi:hypothetical protein
LHDLGRNLRGLDLVARGDELEGLRALPHRVRTRRGAEEDRADQPGRVKDAHAPDGQPQERRAQAEPANSHHDGDVQHPRERDQHIDPARVAGQLADARDRLSAHLRRLAGGV